MREIGVCKRQRKYHVHRLCKASASPWCDFSSTGVGVASRAGVADVEQGSTDRRQVQGDRRKHPRSGRRASDPNGGWRWRRFAWLFAAYATYFSVRLLPQSLKRLPQTLKKLLERPTGG
jgi:hypothetical protein